MNEAKQAFIAAAKMPDEGLRRRRQPAQMRFFAIQVATFFYSTKQVPVKKEDGTPDGDKKTWTIDHWETDLQASSNW